METMFNDRLEYDPERQRSFTCSKESDRGSVRERNILLLSCDVGEEFKTEVDNFGDIKTRNDGM